MPEINLEQQRKRAKDLLRAHHEKNLEAAVRTARHLPGAKGIAASRILESPFTLSEAQFVVAREAGFASWPQLKRHLEGGARDSAEILIDAALRSDADLVEVLSRHGAATQKSIYAAAAIADPDAAFALLAANSNLADQPGGKRGWRPLLYLCYGRSLADEEKVCAIARPLLDLGASPSGREPGFLSTHGTTLSEDQELLAIEAAASRRTSAKLVRLLLDAGADLKQTTSALLQAVRGGSAEVLQILLDALPSEVSWQVGWALQDAVLRHRADLVRMLAAHAELPAQRPLIEAIRRGCGREYLESLTGGEAKGGRVIENAYREAIRCADSAAAEFLRSRGATGSSVTAVDRAIAACVAPDESAFDAIHRDNPGLAQAFGSDDYRMLAWSIRTGRPNAAKLLLKAGLDPNVADGDGQTPLHLAVAANSLELVDALLRRGARPDERDYEGRTPFDLAAGQEHGILQRLLQAGEVPYQAASSLGPEERNALFEAAADAVASGEIETLRRLLDEEPELIRARSPRPHRAMLIHYAGANGVEEERQRTPPNAVAIAELLVARGAEVNATCALYGGGATTIGLLLTSIHPLRAGVRLAVAEVLLKAGACLDSPRGVPGLSEAAALGRIEEAQRLLSENATKRKIQAAFMWACGFGRTRLAEILLAEGADIREQDGNGQTGLHAAALTGSLETVRALLERHPPLELRNVWGGAPLDHTLWASIHHDPTVDYAPIVQALIAAGAKVHPEYLDWIRGETLLLPASKPRIEQLLREALSR